jgi:hypothetical protein
MYLLDCRFGVLLTVLLLNKHAISSHLFQEFVDPHSSVSARKITAAVQFYQLYALGVISVPRESRVIGSYTVSLPLDAVSHAVPELVFSRVANTGTPYHSK